MSASWVAGIAATACVGGGALGCVWPNRRGPVWWWVFALVMGMVTVVALVVAGQGWFAAAFGLAVFAIAAIAAITDSRQVRR